MLNKTFQQTHHAVWCSLRDWRVRVWGCVREKAAPLLWRAAQQLPAPPSRPGLLDNPLSKTPAPRRGSDFDFFFLPDFEIFAYTWALLGMNPRDPFLLLPKGQVCILTVKQRNFPHFRCQHILDVSDWKWSTCKNDCNCLTPNSSFSSLLKSDFSRKASPTCHCLNGSINPGPPNLARLAFLTLATSWHYVFLYDVSPQL